MIDELGDGEAEVTDAVEVDEGEEDSDSIVPEPEAVAGELGPALAAAREVPTLAETPFPEVGPLRESARPLLTNEGNLMNESQGLQSRANGLFDNLVQGVHGNPESKYLWTIDQRGINVAQEQTPFPTPRGNIVHTNLSPQASAGGEAWFGPNDQVTINAGSGRFGDGAGITSEQWDAAVNAWRSLGYDVNPIQFGSR